MPLHLTIHCQTAWRRLVAVAAVLVATSAPAHADERSDLEQLRSTTTALIQALVEQGLLSRERADALLRQAAPRQGEALPMAAAPAASAAIAAGHVAPPVVRVPYLPESLKAQIRNDIKLDVLATARQEGWADARQLPPWLTSLTFEGDVRLRLEGDMFAKGNLSAAVYRSQVDSPAWSPDLTNTQTDRDRLTLRGRFGVTAKVGDDVTTGMRIATGGLTASATESQTLGNDFNRLAVGFDRAFVRWEPSQGLRLEGGRIANPFFGSDLLWPDDLSLDGVAISADRNLASGVFAFGSLGAFALEELPLKSAGQVAARRPVGRRRRLRRKDAFAAWRRLLRLPQH